MHPRIKYRLGLEVPIGFPSWSHFLRMTLEPTCLWPRRKFTLSDIHLSPPPPTCNYISPLRRNYFHMVQRVVKVSLIPTTHTGLIHKKYTFSRSFPSFAFLNFFKYTRTNLQLMYHISSCGKLWTVILMIGINDVCSTNLGHIPVLFFPQENLLGPGTSIVDTIQILHFLRCTQFTQKLMCG